MMGACRDGACFAPTGMPVPCMPFMPLPQGAFPNTHKNNGGLGMPCGAAAACAPSAARRSAPASTLRPLTKSTKAERRPGQSGAET